MIYIVCTCDDPLNYRAGPGKHYQKMGEIPSGCCIIGDDIGNGWVQTALQGETCYLSMEYLQAVEPSGVLCYTDDDIKQVIIWLEDLL